MDDYVTKQAYKISTCVELEYKAFMYFHVGIPGPVHGVIYGYHAMGFHIRVRLQTFHNPEQDTLGTEDPPL